MLIMELSLKGIFLAFHRWIYFLFWLDVFDSRILLCYLHHSFLNYIFLNFSFLALLDFRLQCASELHEKLVKMHILGHAPFMLILYKFYVEPKNLNFYKHSRWVWGSDLTWPWLDPKLLFLKNCFLQKDKSKCMSRSLQWRKELVY